MTVGITNRGNKQGKTRDLKPIMIVLAFVAMAIVAVSTVYANHSNIDGSSVVATIDGEPITYNEFKQSMAGNRAKVAAYFQSKYKVDMGKNFWTTSYNGEVPLVKWKEQALDNLLKIKAPQILAKQKGIVSDISYDTFLRNLDAENKRRVKANENHEVIFGRVQYGESEYYDLVNSNLVGELKKVYDKDSKFSDQALKQYYETNKELYKQQDSIRIMKISASGEDADKVIKSIKANMDNGMTLEQATYKYKQQLNIEDQVFDSRTAHSDTLANPILFLKVSNLKQDEISDVFQENGAHFVVQCIERKVVGYRAFEEVKEAIRHYLAGRAYDQAVDHLIHNAKVVINKEVYGRIK